MGKYDTVDAGERYQEADYRQSWGEAERSATPHHRAEHWVVVSGSAKVTNGDQTFLLSENESFHIPIGVTHALEARGRYRLKS